VLLSIRRYLTCGATATFGSKSLFVDKLGFKPSGKYVTVKNGDGSSQLSMGSVKVTMSIGCNFKAVVTVQIINLDCFDFVIGLDMIKAYKMELRHDPFRVTAMAYSNLRGPSNASRAPRRVHLPICINSLRDDEGHDASHYLCECLVRWKDFDVSHDSWVKRKFLTPPALQAYERFLTEHVRFCEERVKGLVHVPKMYVQQLKSARERLCTFTGNGRYSVFKTSATSLGPTSSPLAAASKTSDVAPDAPTAGEAVVAPIVTSTSGRVLR
jgi:hypothetical protein